MIEQMPSEDRLKSLLVGRKVVEVRMTEERPPGDSRSSRPTGYLTLSDGTALQLWGNDGGCACNAGCYPLTELNTCDNIITNVEVEEKPGSDYDDTEPYEGYYRIFVYADDTRIQLASFDGTDGNGYYGTGWWLTVASTLEPPPKIDPQAPTGEDSE